MLRNRYNTANTGANLTETQLSPSNVNSSLFGKLFQYPVDGSVFAQPLYMSNLAIPNQGTFNVLFICTMNDTVYAFNADKNQTLWSVKLANPATGVTPIPITDIISDANGNIIGYVGIESTPVIDASTNTIYLVARTKEVSGSTTNYVQRLHALDITTGAEKFGGPVAITATVPGTGEQSTNGQVPFNSLMQNQRTALTIANDQVIIAWASHEDNDPYHGWVMSYNKATLAQTGVFCVTPDGSEGGIWMAGRGPAVDSKGNVYLFTGNGTTDSTSDLSEAVLRFNTSNGLRLADYFVASDVNNLNSGDLDISGSGPILIPNTSMLVGGGKQGVLYLLEDADLGHYSAGDKQIPQQFQATPSEIKPGPVFWTSAANGPLLYLWGQQDTLKAFSFNGSVFNTTPVLQSTIETPPGDPGASISISSNGTDDSTAIVWANMPASEYENAGLIAGSLFALSASNPTNVLWSSTQNPSRDAPGYFANFAPPIVANGKMYIGSFSDYTNPNYVNVYGHLTPSKEFTLVGSSAGVDVTPGGSSSLNVVVGPTHGHSFGGTVQLSVSGLPLGVSASFNPTQVTGPGSSTMTVLAAGQAALGSYPLTIIGSESGTAITRKVQVKLTVSTLPGAISIDIVGLGTPMSPTATAGVIAQANWNELSAASQSSPQPLVNENGNATTVTATWAASSNWVLPIANTPANFDMMQGYFDDGAGGTIQFSVQGLPGTPNGYDVYVYADGDNAGATRSTKYTVSGSGMTATSQLLTDPGNTNFSGNFIEVTAASPVGNYMIFHVPGPDFTLVGTGVAATDGKLLAPLNGMQIIPH